MFKNFLTKITDKFNKVILSTSYDDAKVMKQWRTALWVFHGTLCCILAIDGIFGEKFDGFPRGYWEKNIDWWASSHHTGFEPALAGRLASGFIFLPLFFLIIAFVTHYFAYKKRGTRLLGSKIFFLVFMFIFSCKRLIGEVTYNWGSNGCPVGFIFIYIVMFYLSAYYLFNSCKLYAVNRKRKLNRLC